MTMLTRTIDIMLIGCALCGLVMAVEDEPEGAEAAPPAEVAVVFELHAPGLPGETNVFITGSVPALGDWDPGKVAMVSSGDHTWVYRIHTPPGRTIEYKYTLGSWAHEGAGADGRPMPNFSVRVAGATTVTNSILSWTDGWAGEPAGQITGTVRYHRGMQGEAIRPRDVIVWLPPGYDESTDRYPVLYMHDGQNIVDPRTSAFGVDWEVDETCTRLMAEGALPPMIVVGIYNTEDRSIEYVPGTNHAAYLRFVVHDLKPFIDATYRTKPTREHTAVGGSSAGGVCAFLLAWDYPNVFSKALCMSPAFQYTREDGTMAVDVVRTVRASVRPVEPLFFYIDNGGVGLDATLQPGIDAMLEELRRKQFRFGEDVAWILDADAEHNESAWAKRLPRALQLVFPGP